MSRLFAYLSCTAFWALLLVSLSVAGALIALDQNSNQQGDIWEVQYGALSLPALDDTDHDGFSNAMESVAGTNPLNPFSRPESEIIPGALGEVKVSWTSQQGKIYNLYGCPDLNTANWQLLSTVSGDGSELLEALATNGESRWFFRIQSADVDSDADGLSDWEEYQLGFDPMSSHTERNDTADLSRVTSSWSAPSTVTVGLLDGLMREDWPDKGVIAIRRTGGIQPLTINVTFTGSATRDTDYSTITGNQVLMPLGSREVWIELTPLSDGDAEGIEDITVTVTAGAGYSIGVTNNATATLENATDKPGAKEAARFLLQASFGPDQDSASDPDDKPENVEEVMNLGMEAWIEDQFTRPIGYLQPWVEWALENGDAMQLYGNYKENSWWNRVMGVPKLRPDDVQDQLPDPLRQRVAFALSEILVVGDRPEQLVVEQRGMSNYYDKLVQHAFGNYRDLLYTVATHSAMGIYLSHLNNQKANPALKIYPDENFAREVMQLFSIGLWQLNQDGTRKLDGQGQPISTYDNNDITEMARVFTGMTFADKNFPGSYGDYTQPMKMWDAYHDCAAKTLLNGVSLPARTPSSGNTGTAGLADVDEAIGCLFNHPNVGPFIGRLLIQRLVTSNPSPAYIGRVAAAFDDNGQGERGDMKAFIKAILMDPEARDPVMMQDPTFGKLREPFLRVVNLAKAFNATSTSGWYPLDQFSLDHLQDPMNSPSVFNFFLPGHSPPGPITEQGLVAPEFQILNASSSITGPNYFWNAINGSLHRYGNGTAAYIVRLGTDPELSLIVPPANIAENAPSVSLLLESDPLIRRLDLALTGGTLTPRQFQIIRDSIDRVKPPNTSWQWHRERLRLAIYLIVTSAEFNVQQ